MLTDRETLKSPPILIPGVEPSVQLVGHATVPRCAKLHVPISNNVPPGAWKRVPLPSISLGSVYWM